jgi:hypothetical protein
VTSNRKTVSHRKGLAAKETVLNNCLHNTPELAKRPHFIKSWIKAGIGALFYRNLISFRLACRLIELGGLAHE